MILAVTIVSLLLATTALWCLWRVRRLLHVLTSCGDRMAALTTSVSLLTDTTESCFLTLSRQLELVQANGPVKRQRRTSTGRSYASRTAPAPGIAEDASGGETRARTAPREPLAEGELAIRLHVESGHEHARDDQSQAGGSTHDSLFV
jgi:hypothetical protein